MPRIAVNVKRLNISMLFPEIQNFTSKVVVKQHRRPLNVRRTIVHVIENDTKDSPTSVILRKRWMWRIAIGNRQNNMRFQWVDCLYGCSGMYNVTHVCHVQLAEIRSVMKKYITFNQILVISKEQKTWEVVSSWRYETK